MRRKQALVTSQLEKATDKPSIEDAGIQWTFSTIRKSLNKT
jgi:hypothetical protein